MVMERETGERGKEWRGRGRETGRPDADTPSGSRHRPKDTVH